MSDQADSVMRQLQQFGLSKDEVRVYLELLKSNPVSALKLSRDLDIARTKVYRLIEKLLDKGLIKEEVKGYGKKFLAEDPEKLILILNEKEKDLDLLKSSAPNIVKHLTTLQPMMDSDTKIIHYRGEEGLKQVIWNSTKCEGEYFRIYEFGFSMEAFLDHSYSEKVRREFVTNNPKLKYRQLTNLKSIDTDTDVKHMVDNWEVRYLPKEKLDIKAEIQIYNDVYCLYEYHKDDVFIVEIVNNDIAEMQKQIYDLIWEQAQPLKKLGDRGKARLK